MSPNGSSEAKVMPIMTSSSGSILTDSELVFLKGYMDEKPNGGPYHDEVDRHGGDHLAVMQLFHSAVAEGIAISGGIGEINLPAEPQAWPWKDLAEMELRHKALAEARAGRSS